jgi:hypothetical protein
VTVTLSALLAGTLLGGAVLFLARGALLGQRSQEVTARAAEGSNDGAKPERWGQPVSSASAGQAEAVSRSPANSERAASRVTSDAPDMGYEASVTANLTAPAPVERKGEAGNRGSDRGARRRPSKQQVREGAPAVVPLSATLRVSTLIDGQAVPAEVYFDGRHAGQTPLFMRGLSTGTHELVVIKPGFSRWRRQVRLVPGDANKLVLELER